MTKPKLALFIGNRDKAKRTYDISIREQRDNPTMENLTNLRNAHKHLLDAEKLLKEVIP